MVKIAPSISEKTAEDVSKYFHLLNDIERIGDHAKIILDESNEMKNKGIKFSQEAIDEFNKVFEIIEKMFDLSIKAFDNNTQKGIEDFSTLSEKFKNIEKEYVQKHFERLRQGKCSMELGSFFTSTFAHFNSIASHLENIIEDIPMDRIKIIVDKTALIIAKSKEHKDFLFNMTNIKNFINLSVELTMAKLKERNIT